jgi:light-harvesting protein B-800-850 alpha chain
MNNAKMWLVVKPTVGIPLFLGAVAATSLYVHTQVLRNTTWLPAFLQGKPKKAAALEGVGTTATVVFKEVAPSGAGREALVVLPDGRTGTVTFVEDSASRLASAAQSVMK